MHAKFAVHGSMKLKGVPLLSTISRTFLDKCHCWMHYGARLQDERLSYIKAKALCKTKGKGKNLSQVPAHLSLYLLLSF